MDILDMLEDWITGTPPDPESATPTDPSTGLAGLIAPWAAL